MKTQTPLVKIKVISTTNVYHQPSFENKEEDITLSTTLILLKLKITIEVQGRILRCR